ncbi:MAG TPA: hypothetical protein VJB92_03940 [Candidatus Paceibacterota bacterium]
MCAKSLIKVGFMSRLDYGSSDYRIGLWHLAAEVFAKEKVNYVSLLGGLVDGAALEKTLAVFLQGIKKEERETARFAFIQDAANFLKKNIPVIKGVKIYVITSPPYDKQIGEQIAEMLAEMRSDVLLYRAGGDRFELKQIEKILGAYAPKKGVWMRGDYYDTPILRMLKDEKKRTTRGIGDVVAAGGFGAAIFHPGDSSDIRRPYFSIPALCKIGEVRTGENQVGVTIAEWTTSNPKEVTYKVYSFKDLLADEWSSIEAPAGISKVQKAIVDALQKRGPLTVGLLDDFTGYTRKEIEHELEGLMSRKANTTWPSIVQKADKRYYLDMSWFCDKARYKLPVVDKVESFLAFACAHSGSRHTDMQYIYDVLPRLFGDNNLDMFVGVGDFIEGLKHDLMLRKELIPTKIGVMNYTMQERLCTFLWGNAICRVFKYRFENWVKKHGSKNIAKKELFSFIKNNLPRFVFINGNHCAWVEDLGFDPLATFYGGLKTYISNQVTKLLEEYDLCANDLNDLVREKLIFLHQNECYKTPSGLPIVLLHPSMGRTKTTSIRPQEMLQKAEDTHGYVVFGGNFHVGEVVHHWDFEYGQRICLQLGTLKVKSGFEETKLKTVDFGAGMLRVGTAKKRIVTTETTFYCTQTEDVQKGNERVMEEFYKWLETIK